MIRAVVLTSAGCCDSFNECLIVRSVRVPVDGPSGSRWQWKKQVEKSDTKSLDRTEKLN